MSSLQISKILLISVCKYNETYHYLEIIHANNILNILKSLQAIMYFQAICLPQLQKTHHT